MCDRSRTRVIDRDRDTSMVCQETQEPKLSIDCQLTYECIECTGIHLLSCYKGYWHCSIHRHIAKNMYEIDRLYKMEIDRRRRVRERKKSVNFRIQVYVMGIQERMCKYAIAGMNEKEVFVEESRIINGGCSDQKEREICFGHLRDYFIM